MLDSQKRRRNNANGIAKVLVAEFGKSAGLLQKCLVVVLIVEHLGALSRAGRIRTCYVKVSVVCLARFRFKAIPLVSSA